MTTCAKLLIDRLYPQEMATFARLLIGGLHPHGMITSPSTKTSLTEFIPSVV